MDTSLCSAPPVVHAGTAAPEGTTFACVPLSRLLIKHLQHKNICYNIRPKKIKTFTTYACNICVWALQHMQHLDKTLATYV
jgi:hypothetical protein